MRSVQQFLSISPQFFPMALSLTERMTVTARRPATYGNLIDSFHPLSNYGFQTGFSTASLPGLWSRWEATRSSKGQCQIPSHSVFFGTSKPPLRL